MKRQSRIFALVQYVTLTYGLTNKYITVRWAGPCVRWAELRMCSFWAGGISSFYRLLRRLITRCFSTRINTNDQVCIIHVQVNYITQVFAIGLHIKC